MGEKTCGHPIPTATHHEHEALRPQLIKLMQLGSLPYRIFPSTTCLNQFRHKPTQVGMCFCRSITPLRSQPFCTTVRGQLQEGFVQRHRVLAGKSFLEVAALLWIKQVGHMQKPMSRSMTWQEQIEARDYLGVLLCPLLDKQGSKTRDNGTTSLAKFRRLQIPGCSRSRAVRRPPRQQVQEPECWNGIILQHGSCLWSFLLCDCVLTNIFSFARRLPLQLRPGRS